MLLDFSELQECDEIPTLVVRKPSTHSSSALNIIWLNTMHATLKEGSSEYILIMKEALMYCMPKTEIHRYRITANGETKHIIVW